MAKKTKRKKTAKKKATKRGKGEAIVLDLDFSEEKDLSSKQQKAMLQLVKEREILQRYLSGQTQTQIAAYLGIAVKSVSYVTRKAETEWKKERIELRDSYVLTELAKLNLLEQDLIDHLKAEDISDYSDKVLKIQKRRSDLLGLDAPTRVELAGSGGGPIKVRAQSMTDEELEEVIRAGKK